METTLSDIAVMFVRAEGGPAGARQAFASLEAKLPSTKGRKFYGVFHRGEYRACVAIAPGDDPAALGLQAAVIPGGHYARARLYDWQQKVDRIHEVFMGLHEGRTVDDSRPDVEFYRSARELVCLLPIR